MVATTAPELDTFADLLEKLGNVPLDRILLQPPPGTATEKDVVRLLEAPNKRLCELVHGVLVEKAMSTLSSLIALRLGHYLLAFLEVHDIGAALGPDGAVRLFPGLVRIPDISFVSWDQCPQGIMPEKAILGLVPCLAVEVLSPSNTEREIEQKIKNYFAAGVEAVWIVHPENETVDVLVSPRKRKKLTKDQVLEGGTQLPGFRLPLKKLFAPRQRRNKK